MRGGGGGEQQEGQLSLPPPTFENGDTQPLHFFTSVTVVILGLHAGNYSPIVRIL